MTNHHRQWCLHDNYFSSKKTLRTIVSNCLTEPTLQGVMETTPWRSTVSTSKTMVRMSAYDIGDDFWRKSNLSELISARRQRTGILQFISALLKKIRKEEEKSDTGAAVHPIEDSRDRMRGFILSFSDESYFTV